VKNTLLLNKIIELVQSKLCKFESNELEELSRRSKDEAIQLTLVLNKHPVPPMPDFEIESEYQDNQKLTDMIDDRTHEAAVDDYFDNYGYNDDKMNLKKKNKSSSSSSSDAKPLLTDSEATALCTEWKKNYQVVTGVSWGSLPFDLQQKWIEYSCDYHLPQEGEIT
jgi:hypothetical protein